MLKSVNDLCSYLASFSITNKNSIFFRFFFGGGGGREEDRTARRAQINSSSRPIIVGLYFRFYPWFGPCDESAVHDLAMADGNGEQPFVSKWRLHAKVVRSIVLLFDCKT